MPRDSILSNFADYVIERNIDVNPLISPHRFPGRGFGIRANADIPPETRLMFMPTETIVKWSDIPSDFMPCPPPPAKDGGVRVHSRLASWLAFSDDAKRTHEAWMATWPRLEDFKMSMPGLWPDGCREGHFPEGRQRRVKAGINGTKKRKVQKTEERTSFAILPFSVTGRWFTIPTSASNGPHGVLAPQQHKFESDLAAAARYFPSIKDKSSSDHQKFLWAWWCVSTRCFYYWPTWSSRTNGSGKLQRPPPAPEDRDEAMVMCPGMDLFNHDSDEDSGLRCFVKYDDSGFTVTSPNVLVRQGEELFISYGAHSEEHLWVEYGFMLGGDKNKWNHINLDAVVLHDSRLGTKEQARLKERGYEGDYNLRSDGVCWRTEIAARTCVLTQESWEGFVDGTYEESDDENSAAGEIIVEWITKVKGEAINSLKGLLDLTDAERIAIFTQPSDGDDDERRKLAQNRTAICVSRWEQIEQICESALRAVQDIT